MNQDNLTTLIVGVLGGTALKALIDLLRFRRKDGADADKTLHDSQTSSLTVTSALLETWIKAASAAQDRIVELQHLVSAGEITKAEMQVRLTELEHANRLCKESLQRCRQGCKEKII